MTGDAQRRISSVAPTRCTWTGRDASSVVLIGVLEERVHAVGDRVAGGLVAGDRQQQEEEVEVHVGQRLAVDLGAEQRGDDVVTRLACVASSASCWAYMNIST